MRLLLPVGVVLIVIGTAGSATACFGNAIFSGDDPTTVAEMQGQTAAPAGATDTEETSRLLLAPLSGLVLAIGLGCVGIGMGHWRRPVPSGVRPANPWSDQPREHGDPPVGQV